MSKVEEVALAMYRHEHGGDCENQPWSDDSTADYWRAAARVAISALREPTQEIIDAAEPAMRKVNHIVAHAGGVQWDNDEPPLVPAWRAMIDACLK